MSGSFKTTYPTWHQPWCCLDCEKHGEVIIHVTGPSQEFLRKMTRDVDAEHRSASPLCPRDISTAYPKDHPRLPLALSRGYRGPMLLGRPFRRSANTGQLIYAEGPNEDAGTVETRVKKEAWPPWMQSN